ncbi:MAG: tRNA uridine-5-carboxymethylaminomethyl(34) synthesis enzyme MnmG [Sphaerochaetaceae bacterium]|nr:tRNA uridine-5-carboxymethylaminomethyl(34) synthesis enzyme MnmG [Sphaerochaetaceae bacterium]MDC7238151.1 tRNA uridine-5-carboxymethylaminomethyl(34) synthesis enzyme MnmG [Sphaerochaetaceae bacterium]MDC7248327.1 tRNA uridine-5-carboxymethylaminomethyl(34) synthesis enzyme MnmG [Sphaerochaetaceae bacterium]
MDYDVIVIGGGHAGIEACLATSRIGFKTLLVTQNIDAIGRLSCNPAIGGLAKGNIVREVDALGGEMAHLIDSTMIQYRILNRRRGPAVQSPRAQADKFAYHMRAKHTLELQNNLEIFMDTVVDLMIDHDKNVINGVITERGHRISSKTVVLTTGTFMEGKIFIGQYDAPCGRLGESAAIGLGTALRKHGFTLGRMKTGTPARVRRSSIDFSELEIQAGDDPMMPFSFDYETIERPSIPCYITWTNEKTHAIIKKHMHLSPLYGGKIVGKGPRYCPSIEDKVVRFPDRNRHQIFIEPEGENSEEMYLNGLSSSLPEFVQNEFMRTLKGLENVEVMRPAYAVEYDYMDPLQLLPSLETIKISGLFIAGQTNGTSGYEEAACQGLMAGINAAQKLKGEDSIVLSRAESYTGVLIDDLVTKGTKEPYRMFTSRAEYRLNMRHDSCDQRLTELAYKVGLQSEEKLERLKNKLAKIESVKELLKQNSYNQKNALQALKMPEVEIDDMMEKIVDLSLYSEPIRYQTQLDVKYEGYIKKQEKEVKRFASLESIRIADDFDYDSVSGMSSEGIEKCKQIRPRSIGQASRISGLRTTDIAVLMVHVKKWGSKK